MGSHSSEAKRRKRKEQKRKKRALKRLKLQEGSTECSDLESSAVSELDTSEYTHHNDPTSKLDELPTGTGETEGDLFTLLDRVAEKKEKFWEEVEPEIQQLESYRDAHPSLVLDQDRYIEVFVGGDSQDHRGLLRVSTEEYFAKIHHRETKAMGLCKILRDRIENLEKELETGRQKLVTVHKEKNRAVGAMRDFWRNKIFEQQSYGGKMVLAALRRGYF
jgi:hypothetical protein